MGLEAKAEMIHDGAAIAVKALLESHDLILRAPVKKTLAIAAISGAHVTGDVLHFQHDGTAYALTLPPGQAGKWLKKLTTPPPSLASKLGIDPARPALVQGDPSDADLFHALKDAVTTEPEAAAMGIAIAVSSDELAGMIGTLINALPAKPIWVVFPKGAGSPLPESVVRAHMRGLGYVDTKACSVSQRLTASRYSPRS